MTISPFLVAHITKMPAENKLELVIQVDAAGANASIKSVNTNLSGLEKTAVSSAKGASNDSARAKA